MVTPARGWFAAVVRSSAGDEFLSLQTLAPSKDMATQLAVRMYNDIVGVERVVAYLEREEPTAMEQLKPEISIEQVMVYTDDGRTHLLSNPRVFKKASPSEVTPREETRVAEVATEPEQMRITERPPAKRVPQAQPKKAAPAPQTGTAVNSGPDLLPQNWQSMSLGEANRGSARLFKLSDGQGGFHYVMTQAARPVWRASYEAGKPDMGKAHAGAWAKLRNIELAFEDRSSRQPAPAPKAAPAVVKAVAKKQPQASVTEEVMLAMERDYKRLHMSTRASLRRNAIEEYDMDSALALESNRDDLIEHIMTQKWGARFDQLERTDEGWVPRLSWDEDTREDQLRRMRKAGLQTLADRFDIEYDDNLTEDQLREYVSEAIVSQLADNVVDEEYMAEEMADDEVDVMDED